MNKALTDDELDLLRQEWDHANSELDDDTSDAWEVMCAKAGNDLLRLLNTVTAARDHAAISIARSASDGLAKEAAMALLRTARQWHGHAADCLASVIAPSNDGFVDMEACDCGWRELAAEIDAALDARDLQPAHSAHSDTVDTVTAVGERKDE